GSQKVKNTITAKKPQHAVRAPIALNLPAADGAAAGASNEPPLGGGEAAGGNAGRRGEAAGGEAGRPAGPMTSRRWRGNRRRRRGRRGGRLRRRRGGGVGVDLEFHAAEAVTGGAADEVAAAGGGEGHGGGAAGERRPQGAIWIAGIEVRPGNFRDVVVCGELENCASPSCKVGGLIPTAVRASDCVICGHGQVEQMRLVKA
ncbi:SMAD/FHA domain-containing protein, partial [Striga asiatica]